MQTTKNYFIKYLTKILKRNVILKPSEYIIKPIDMRVELENLNRDKFYEALEEIKEAEAINFIIENEGSNIELYMDIEPGNRQWTWFGIHRTLQEIMDILVEDYDFQLKLLYEKGISLDEIETFIKENTFVEEED